MSESGTRRPSMMETVQTTDGFLRHAGRDFLVVLYTVFRSLKLYPIENAQVQKALDDLAGTTKHLLDVEREIEIRLQGEFIFVNSTRLRLDLDNYASFSHILNVFSQCGIGAVRLDEGVDRKQLRSSSPCCSRMRLGTHTPTNCSRSHRRWWTAAFRSSVWSRRSRAKRTWRRRSGRRKPRNARTPARSRSPKR